MFTGLVEDTGEVVGVRPDSAADGPAPGRTEGGVDDPGPAGSHRREGEA